MAVAAFGTTIPNHPSLIMLFGCFQCLDFRINDLLYYIIFLQELRKTTNNLSQNRQPPVVIQIQRKGANHFTKMSQVYKGCLNMMCSTLCFTYRTVVLPTYHDGDDMSDLACHLKHNHWHWDSVCHRSWERSSTHSGIASCTTWNSSVVHWPLQWHVSASRLLNALL
jgi:hypothetical protein